MSTEPKSFVELGVSQTNFSFTLSSGRGAMSGVFTTEDSAVAGNFEQRDIPVSTIPKHVIRFALSRNPFYHFDSLRRFFPNIGCQSNFIASKDYLGGLEITVSGTKSRIESIFHSDYLNMMQELLSIMEQEIKSNFTEYEGSDYLHGYVHSVFTDKDIRVHKDSERSNGQEDLVKDKDWYAFNANYGTSEEKAFVDMFARRFDNMALSFSDIYLIRNERALKIIDKVGRAFEPDFLLFCTQRSGKELTYQVFIEPKGVHLASNDKWKEDFLKEIRDAETTLRIDGDKYRITGVPFYNYANEIQFGKVLNETLGIS